MYQLSKYVTRSNCGMITSKAMINIFLENKISSPSMFQKKFINVVDLSLLGSLLNCCIYFQTFHHHCLCIYIHPSPILHVVCSVHYILHQFVLKILYLISRFWGGWPFSAFVVVVVISLPCFNFFHCVFAAKLFSKELCSYSYTRSSRTFWALQ